MITNTNIDIETEVKKTIEYNASMMDSMLDTIECDRLITPDKGDYRVVIIFPGVVKIEVDILMRRGAKQRIRLPFTDSIDQIEANIGAVRRRLTRTLAKLEELLEQRNLIRKEASRQVSLARHQGIELRVTSVELAIIDPDRIDRVGDMDVHYEASVDHEPQTFREELSVSSVEEASIRTGAWRDELSSFPEN